MPESDVGGFRFRFYFERFPNADCGPASYWLLVFQRVGSAVSGVDLSSGYMVDLRQSSIPLRAAGLIGDSHAKAPCAVLFYPRSIKKNSSGKRKICRNGFLGKSKKMKILKFSKI